MADPGTTVPDAIAEAIGEKIPWALPGQFFTAQLIGTGRWPSQGWKLHVSATPGSASAVLACALPVLLNAGARFKVVNSRRNLAAMNSGLFGDTQVGKFITVYPSDDAEAVGLAQELHRATAGLRGPRVPTDRPLRPGSLVHYRYGGFWNPPGSETSGYDMFDPVGRLTIDWRCSYYLPPGPEIPDPFEAAGVLLKQQRRKGALARRFLVHQALDRSWRGGVYRAIDLASQPPRQCLLKELWRDVGADDYGEDPVDWAENETRILIRHDGDAALPRCFGSFELDGNHYVVLEFVEGRTLAEEFGGLLTENTGLAVPQLLSVATGTAAALASIHDLGIVYRDFKPSNLIHSPDGSWRLIDFGIAYDALDTHPPVTGGTPEFCSPEQWSQARPAASDDVFAWGAVLHALACGYQSLLRPGDGVDPGPVRRASVGRIRPSLPAELAAVIDRACAWEPAGRFASMAEVQRALLTAGGKLDATSLSVGAVLAAAPTLPAAPIDPETAMKQVIAIGTQLCNSAEEQQGGLRWLTKVGSDEAAAHRPDIYDGTAGIVLFLAALAHATGSSCFADAARGGARWLAGPEWAAGRAAPGLHCGESGIVVTFLRLADLLGEEGWLTAADLRARRLKGVPFTTLDLLYGAAGFAVAHAELALATGDTKHLAEAKRAGSILLAAAEAGPQGRGLVWRIPSNDPSLAPSSLLGLSHGAAGVGLALVYLYRATGDERFMAAAAGAAEMLIDQAVVGGDEGWRWPRALGEDQLDHQAWCHGAAGIGVFFLQLYAIDQDKRWLTAVKGAAIATENEIESKERLGLCCGLAGDGSFLLDAAPALGGAWLDLAARCGSRILERIRSGRNPSPDLMQGEAGIGAFMLRLARPDQADLILPQRSVDPVELCNPAPSQASG